jgi:hypothetical protein
MDHIYILQLIFLLRLVRPNSQGHPWAGRTSPFIFLFSSEKNLTLLPFSALFGCSEMIIRKKKREKTGSGENR